MRTILVTGINGQVGHKLLSELKVFGRIVATDIHDPQIKGLDFRPVDFADPEAVAELVRTVRPDAVVNPAAYTAVDKAEAEPELARKVNADAVRALGTEAKKQQIPLVHYSTDYVFAGTGSKPWTETDRTGPLSVYGQSKLEGEFGLSASGCSHIVLRTSWVFSDHGANFVKTMLRLGAEKERLQVVGDQFGAPTSAAMLARMTRLVLERAFATGKTGFAPFSGVYHLTSTGTTSWHGFATAIFARARALGFPLKVASVEAIPTEAYPTPARRPLNSRLDCTKFIETFGVRPEGWEVSLDETLAGLRGSIKTS
jgi:dTDP-4-dehydrorhamnose reductase